MNGTTTFGGNQFELAQFHIHTPSEHRINREYFPLEVHMVHKGIGKSSIFPPRHPPYPTPALIPSYDPYLKLTPPPADPTQLVVLALMFELCTQSSDPIIAGITPHLDAIREPGSHTTIESGIDFSGVLSIVESSNIFQYSGSLTTPPCSEGVTFLAVETPLKINVPDFNAIKKLVKYNSRLSQNTLGSDNIIEVAAIGMETCANNGTVPVFGGNSTAPVPVVEEEATPVEGAPEAGSTITITEISGSPLPTDSHYAGVVQRGMRFRQ